MIIQDEELEALVEALDNHQKSERKKDHYSTGAVLVYDIIMKLKEYSLKSDTYKHYSRLYHLTVLGNLRDGN